MRLLEWLWPKGGGREIKIGLWIAGVAGLGGVIYTSLTGSWTLIYAILIARASLPVWLVLILSGVSVAAAVALLRHLKKPGHVSQYHRDTFDLLGWVWKYEPDGTIADATPVCPIHLSDVRMSETTVNISATHQNQRATQIRCPDCNDAWCIVGTTNVKETEALPKIRGFIRRIEWKSRVKNYERNRLVIANQLTKILNDQREARDKDALRLAIKKRPLLEPEDKP